MAAITLSADNKRFEPAPEGVHIARCVSVIFAGTYDSEWKGKKRKRTLLRLTWELPLALKTEGDFAGEPFLVSKTYTASLSEKADLFKMLVAWRGKKFTDDELKAFAIGKLVGKYCQIQIVHEDVDGTTYANISTVMAIPAGTPLPPGKQEPFSYSVVEHTQAEFDKLTPKQQEWVQGSDEWKERENGEVLTAASGGADKKSHAQELAEDDIPFVFNELEYYAEAPLDRRMRRRCV